MLQLLAYLYSQQVRHGTQIGGQLGEGALCVVHRTSDVASCGSSKLIKKQVKPDSYKQFNSTKDKFTNFVRLFMNWST